jgi:hypothetical protein
MGESAAVTVEATLSLYGRLEASETASRGVVTFYADSISYVSKQPYVFHTFMSADTMRYGARGGVVDRPGAAEFDSMLACVFRGPTLHIFLLDTGAPDSTVHVNERCESGEYEHINAPVTLSSFLVERRAAAGGERARWRETRAAPSFSGVGFHPEIEFLYREVDASGTESTIAVAADSTFENLRTTMKNGEEVVVTSDRFRIGGTLIVDRATGLPSRGELRIRETLELVRPSASGMVIRKTGEYTIRFSLP